MKAQHKQTNQEARKSIGQLITVITSAILIYGTASVAVNVYTHIDTVVNTHSLVK